MKCEVMTGGCWAAGRVTAGPQVRVAMVTGPVTVETETQASCTYTLKLRSSTHSIASTRPVNFNVTPINECLMVK